MVTSVGMGAMGPMGPMGPMGAMGPMGYGQDWHRVAVTTHTAQAPFRFVEWVDQSPDATAIDFIMKHKLARLDFKLNVNFSPIAS